MFETDEQRVERQRRRLRFDAIADQYDEFRPQYPHAMVERIVETAELGAGSRVLEIGCGTGQLTQDLADRGFAVTAVDPGEALVERARHRVSADVDFQVSTFEDLAAPDQAFDVIVSASAFHWVDPEVRWTKTAALLDQGGWLALIDTVLDYEEPLMSHIRRLWLEHSSDGGAWAANPPPTMIEQIRESARFEDPVAETFASHVDLGTDVVVALSQTSAAFLSYTDGQKTSFTRQLRQALPEGAHVTARMGASLLLAQRRQRGE
jgi:ubiquinone/menaquinone biosynthesis C-methylase UbiE